MRLRIVVTFAFLELLHLTTSSDVILKPLKSSATFADGLLILMPAPLIAAENYTQTAIAIQNASSPPLWVAVPQFPAVIALTEDDVATAIERIIPALHEAGMNSTNKLFFAAHSLSAFPLQSYLNVSHRSINASGLILFGSYLMRKYMATFPIPTLSVAGELDGFARITRIMESYYKQILKAKNPKSAVATSPVVVIEGMNHYGFSSDDVVAPAYIKSRDLCMEIPIPEAHARVAEIVAAFMSVTENGSSDALTTMTTAVQATATFLEPLVEAFELENSYHFKPPCYEQNPGPQCNVGCRWSEIGQEAMGGLAVGKLTSHDEFHPLSEILPHVHHPQILNNCSAGDSSCVLRVATVSNNIYQKSQGDGEDESVIPMSAVEIRVKMKSRQAVVEASGSGPVDFNKTDGPSLCQMINEMAYKWALNRTANKTLTRYLMHGELMYMKSDEGPYDIYPMWQGKILQYNVGSDEKGNSSIFIQSPMFKTSTSFIIGGFAGMHYCKLLSPARALEWMYGDSLRARYSL